MVTLLQLTKKKAELKTRLCKYLKEYEASGITNLEAHTLKEELQKTKAMIAAWGTQEGQVYRIM